MKVDSGSLLKPGHCSPSPWFLAVTCLVSASPDEYMTSGIQRCSAVDTRSRVSLRSCAHAKVTGYHNVVSSCSSGASGRQDLRAFAAALEATPVSACVIADYWKNHTGGGTSDRHPEELFFRVWMPVDFVSSVKQHVLRFSLVLTGSSGHYSSGSSFLAGLFGVGCCLTRKRFGHFWEKTSGTFPYTVLSWLDNGYSSCVSRRCFWFLFHTFPCERRPRILRSILGQFHEFSTSPSYLGCTRNSGFTGRRVLDVSVFPRMRLQDHASVYGG